jgi:hypothetical protein
MNPVRERANYFYKDDKRRESQMQNLPSSKQLNRETFIMYIGEKEAHCVPKSITSQ